MRVGFYVKKLRSVTNGGVAFTAMNALGRFGVIRKLQQARMRAVRPALVASIEPRSDLLEPLVLQDLGRTLERDGAAAGLSLRPHVLAQMREALHGQPCYGFGQPQFAFRNAERAEAERRYERKFLQAHYYGLDRIHPLFAELREDRALKQLLRNYFRCEPVWTGTRAWWSYAVDASEEEQRDFGQAFHYDVDDYLSLNIFFYLTDVDLEGGAHVLVRGTHRTKPLRHRLRPRRSRTDEDVRREYGEEAFIRLCGPAGFGFVEDPFCYHKALHPRSSDRLVLQLRYALTDYQVGTETAHRAWLANSLPDAPREGRLA